jgi:hypothetical protein
VDLIWFNVLTGVYGIEWRSETESNGRTKFTEYFSKKIEKIQRKSCLPDKTKDGTKMRYVK